MQLKLLATMSSSQVYLRIRRRLYTYIFFFICTLLRSTTTPLVFFPMTMRLDYRWMGCYTDDGYAVARMDGWLNSP